MQTAVTNNGAVDHEGMVIAKRSRRRKASWKVLTDMATDTMEVGMLTISMSALCRRGRCDGIPQPGCGFEASLIDKRCVLGLSNADDDSRDRGR